MQRCSLSGNIWARLSTCRLKVAQASAYTEKGSGRLNACPTMLSEPLTCRGGAGGFACVIPISQLFSAQALACVRPILNQPVNVLGAPAT
jgi:hypothetical protein